MPGLGGPSPTITYSFKSVGDLRTDRKFSSSANPPTPLGFKTPLRLGENRTGIFDMYTDLRKLVKDNLKNLIMTNHGERLGNFAVGANLRSLCTERLSREDFDAEAMRRIQTAVGKFMPYIKLLDYASTVKVDKSNPIQSISQVTVTLLYNVPQLKVAKEKAEATIYTIG